MTLVDEAVERAAEAAFRVMYPDTAGQPDWDKWHVEGGPPKGLKESVKDKWREIARAALVAAFKSR